MLSDDEKDAYDKVVGAAKEVGVTTEELENLIRAISMGWELT